MDMNLYYFHFHCLSRPGSGTFFCIRTFGITLKDALPGLYQEQAAEIHTHEGEDVS